MFLLCLKCQKKVKLCVFLNTISLGAFPNQNRLLKVLYLQCMIQFLWKPFQIKTGAVTERNLIQTCHFQFLYAISSCNNPCYPAQRPVRRQPAVFTRTFALPDSRIISRYADRQPRGTTTTAWSGIFRKAPSPTDSRFSDLIVILVRFLQPAKA